MNRRLTEELYGYLAQKSERNGAEHYMMCELKDQLNYFHITSVHRDDLASKGFDVDNVDDGIMEELASKLSDDYCNQLFWESMEIIASQGLEIPKHMCPKCGEDAQSYVNADKTANCSCGNNWKIEPPTGRYVKVEHPEDNSFYEEHEVGYESYNSEDNGAMYVPENFYKAHEGKEPNQSAIYVPVTWPESQEYFELENELCEPINYGKAFNDFNSQTIWVPLTLMQKQ